MLVLFMMAVPKMGLTLKAPDGAVFIGVLSERALWDVSYLGGPWRRCHWRHWSCCLRCILPWRLLKALSLTPLIMLSEMYLTLEAPEGVVTDATDHVVWDVSYLGGSWRRCHWRHGSCCLRCPDAWGWGPWRLETGCCLFCSCSASGSLYSALPTPWRMEPL